MNLKVVLHRISGLRMNRDDFDESYCPEHERLLLKMIESVNRTIDEAIILVYQISSEDQFTITVRKD